MNEAVFSINYNFKKDLKILPVLFVICWLLPSRQSCTTGESETWGEKFFFSTLVTVFCAISLYFSKKGRYSFKIFSNSIVFDFKYAGKTIEVKKEELREIMLYENTTGLSRSQKSHLMYILKNKFVSDTFYNDWESQDFQKLKETLDKCDIPYKYFDNQKDLQTYLGEKDFLKKRFYEVKKQNAPPQ
jgi:hypothetical protein